MSENGETSIPKRFKLCRMPLQPQHCYEALKARDARFDGVFFVGVSSTGIYCRPICRVRMPMRKHCQFFANAAAAETAGYRPCMRCRPELAPGVAHQHNQHMIADRAVARIEAGALSEAGLDSLATEFGISARQLRRLIVHAYGVTPTALAQTQRLLLAKQLLTDTTMTMADVAFASGFSSVRRFNHLFRTRYRLAPGALRKQRHPQSDTDGITLKLGFRPPLAWEALTAFLAQRGARSVEQCEDGCYRRTVSHGTHKGWISVARDDHSAALVVTVASELASAIPWLRSRLRHLFDLDADPTAITTHLRHDPRLATRIDNTPGLRIPGTINGFELALRAILGQQISVKAASTLCNRFATYFGEPVDTPFDGLNRLAPHAETIADASLQQIIDRGLPSRRAETIRTLARAVASRELRLDTTATADQTRTALQALPGIGPWTAHYISMRALGDPDAFPDRDLGLMRALNTNKSGELHAMAEPWRPWRAYAAMYIWHHQGAGG